MASLQVRTHAPACSSQLVARAGPGRPARRAPLRVQAVAAPPAQAGPTIVNGQVLHSITPERLALFSSEQMGKFAEEQVLPILKPVDKCWQPQDFLPAPESPEFLDAVSEAQKQQWLVQQQQWDQQQPWLLGGRHCRNVCGGWGGASRTWSGGQWWCAPGAARGMLRLPRAAEP